MKKLTLTIAFLASMFAPVALQAQDAPSENPNRLLVVDNQGYYKAYMIERVDQLAFREVSGEVAAKVEFLSFEDDVLHVAITKTEDCQYYYVTVLPTLIADKLETSEIAISYVRDWGQPFYDDFTNAAVSGVELSPSTSYTFMTVGVDQYGVMCDVSRVSFTTPAPEIQGDPKVELTFSDITTDSFTCTFEPNEDVKEYYFVSGPKGELEAQYEMFAPMFGYSNMGQMIMAWGISYSGDQTYTYMSMNPNTEYEVLVQPIDFNGEMAPYQTFYVSTEGLGGHGEASVTITVGEYKNMQWGDEVTPSQFMTFTPNDQSSRYRFAVYTAAEYDASPEGCNGYVQSEPPFPGMAYWWFYDETTTDYQIDPKTDCVAVASAQNIDNEWGPIVTLRFTTPNEPMAVRGQGNIIPRFKPTRLPNQAGTVPAIQTKSSTVTLK